MYTIQLLIFYYHFIFVVARGAGQVGCFAQRYFTLHFVYLFMIYRVITIFKVVSFLIFQASTSRIIVIRKHKVASPIVMQKLLTCEPR